MKAYDVFVNSFTMTFKCQGQIYKLLCLSVATVNNIDCT